VAPLVRLTAALLVLAGCAHGPPAFDPARRPTCLVLSVGGADGVVHLGAIAALKQAGVPIACVVGSSMGALVGAVYATAPAVDTRRRFEALVRAYATATETAARRKGFGLALLFGAAAKVFSDSDLVPAIAAGGGYLLGLGTTDKLDRDRLVSVMDEFFAGRRIEGLPVPYAALYQRREGTNVALVTARTGNLAEAVGGSVANPFLFPAMDVSSAAALDPGADRAAAVPLEEACHLFPGANLLAINVTGHPAFFSAKMTCPILEVSVPPSGLPPEEALSFGTSYQQAVTRGFQATMAALTTGMTTR
jgi:predicted acylesterase/phospholipase RssA